MPKPLLHIQGMHGLGDCIHQRAILRVLMQTNHCVLETSWASPYHDLVGEDLRLARRNTALRTQMKNLAREHQLGRFSNDPAHLRSTSTFRIMYNSRDIRTVPSGTILEVMFRSAGIQARFPEADFRMPVKQIWLDSIDALIGTWRVNKPLLVYRPPVERNEWRGGTLRNPRPEQYAEIMSWLRDHYFVVSIADLEPHREWINGPVLRADRTFHRGELVFEALAALFKRAAVVVSAGGFATVLGAAVETPVIAVTGGYEPPSSHADCGKFSPLLQIHSTKLCDCFTSTCNQQCDRLINLTAAREKLTEFSAKLGLPTPAETRPLNEIFDFSQAQVPILPHDGNHPRIIRREQPARPSIKA